MNLATDQPSLSVLFAAPECAPLTKTGGLGDVCGSLPAALRGAGIDARVLMPGYPEVLAVASEKALASVSALGFDAHLREARLPGNGVPLLVLDCPQLYARSGGPYQMDGGADWPDNAVRFGLLSRVAAILASARSPLPWRPEVLHCNDWPTALAPLYLSMEKQKARSVMTIHNLAFQGNFDAGLMAALSLPPESYAIDGLEFYGRISFLKGGIVYADAVTTVSPTYAKEIQAEPFGCGMDGLLRQRSHALSGVLNGIDASTWDPARDVLIAKKYEFGSIANKSANKAALQRRLGLPVDPKVPLLGTVGRMAQQKGTDLIAAAAGELASMAQLVVVGTGDRALEQSMLEKAQALKGRMAVHIGFSEELAHLVEAGADAFLMPSRYEPCGLNQMYSQRYGTPPIARATGGLADTIEDGITGFLFDRPESDALVETARRAMQVYRNPAAWREIQRAGMARDFSWDAAARRYAGLYWSLASQTA
jgi:starch synthase